MRCVVYAPHFIIEKGGFCLIIVFIAAAFLAAADQLFKILVTNTLKPDKSVSIPGGLVNFQYLENRGMAFGMLKDFRWIFIVFTLAVIIGIVVYLAKVKPTNKLLLTALALVTGGGIGNLIDRIFLGYVVDYIQLSFFQPVCNFADYCITFGTVLLLIYIVFFSDKEDKKLKS